MRPDVSKSYMLQLPMYINRKMHSVARGVAIIINRRILQLYTIDYPSAKRPIFSGLCA